VIDLDACPAQPCLRLACRHNLLVDVTRHGTIRVVGGPTIPPRRSATRIVRPSDLDDAAEIIAQRAADLGTTCALAYANRGGMTLADVGRVLRLTRERARQIADHAAASLAPVLNR